MTDSQKTLKRAIALKYQMYEDGAPRIVAKGQGLIADRIIKIANENNIPIKEDKDLIDILSKIDIMQEIPFELYKVVAELLAYVYRVNNKLINIKAS